MKFAEILKIKNSGIYIITNKISQKVYIGQAKIIRSRIKSHLNSTINENAKDYNYPIHKAFRKYGLDNFDFDVLEYCENKDLNQREIYWIKQYNSRDNGYNQTLGGKQNIRHIKLTQQDVNLIIEALKLGKTNKQIAEQFNISTCMITRINTGIVWHNDALDYPIRKETSMSSKYNYNGFCVCQVDKEDNILNIFTSTHAAAQILFNDDRKHSHIAACLRGERKSAWGFIWKAKEVSETEWKDLKAKEIAV